MWKGMGLGRGTGRSALTAAYFWNGSTAPVASHPYWPWKLLRAYQRVFHTARWLLAILILIVIGTAVLRRTYRGRRLQRRPHQIVLIGGPPLAILTQAPTVQFAVGY